MKILSEKQFMAYQRLVDNVTNFVFMGGAAYGGKSFLGCYWTLTQCIVYPGVSYFIGRDSLKDTRESVLKTMDKVSNRFSLNGFKYSNDSLEFSNGSDIKFLDLSFYPQKDPFYERFGSKEYTGGWIEEAGEVKFDAFDTLKSRIGRHMNKEYNIKSKLLITANPKKNWLYSQFYKPFINGRLPDNYFFQQAYYYDNIDPDTDYVENNLKAITDKVKRARLLDGNFEYDGDPSVLIPYEKILDIFTNEYVEGGKKYITADIARFGADRAVIMVWDGWRVVHMILMDKSATTEIESKIRECQRRFKVSTSNTIVDEDGVGGGVKDHLKCKGFVNNSKPIRPKRNNYANLKTQCQYYLAKKINSGELFVALGLSETLKEEIIEELEQLKADKSDDDKKLYTVPKEEIKSNIKRSPDFLDTLTFRAYFDLNPSVAMAY